MRGILGIRPRNWDALSRLFRGLHGISFRVSAFGGIGFSWVSPLFFCFHTGKPAVVRQ